MSARVLSRTQASALFGAALGTVWNTLGDAQKETVYSKYLKEIKDPHAQRISNRVGYFTKTFQKAEQTGIQYDDVKIGASLTINPQTEALGFRATFEALDDMSRKPFGSFDQAGITAASRIAEGFRKASKQRKEILCANLILNAQTSTGTAGRAGGAGYDSVALASASHPILSNTSVLGGTTFSNVGASSSLSQSALQTMLETIETQPTLEGLVRDYTMKYYLVVGPALRNTAYTVVETTKQGKLVGSFDHDVPGLKDFEIIPVVNRFFGASSTVYALIGENAQVGYWDYSPETLEDEEDFETKGHKWSVHWRFAELHEGPYDFMQSAGA